jgi:hypothetical protein
MMQVRSRAKADLERLIEHIVDSGRGLPATADDIIETPEADYRWRILMSKGQWIDVAEMLADAIDYENFKNAAHSTQSDKPLMAIWNAMADYQSGTIRRQLSESDDDFPDDEFPPFF